MPTSRDAEHGGRKGGLEMGEFEEKGDINLNLIFADSGRDLNRLFPESSLRRLLMEIEENKRGVKSFLNALEVEDEEDD